MYTFDITNKNNILAKVCVDEESSQIGFVWFLDDELNEILKMLVEMPYLIVKNSGYIDNNYIVFDEKISISDERYFDVLQCQLNQYDFVNKTNHVGKTIKELLET